MGKRKQYSEQFKKDAVRLMLARGTRTVEEVAKGLGVGASMLHRWQLSPAEKEVGLLLLKGLSHEEVAQMRSVTEATARQQAGALYKKAGLSGRHDLAAFFLEDLMLPGAAPPST